MSNPNYNLKMDRLDELVLLFLAVIAVLVPPALFGVF